MFYPRGSYQVHDTWNCHKKLQDYPTDLPLPRVLILHEKLQNTPKDLPLPRVPLFHEKLQYSLKGLPLPLVSPILQAF
jgi:hypothetical protein